MYSYSNNVMYCTHGSRPTLISAGPERKLDQSLCFLRNRTIQLLYSVLRCNVMRCDGGPRALSFTGGGRREREGSGQRRSRAPISHQAMPIASRTLASARAALSSGAARRRRGTRSTRRRIGSDRIPIPYRYSYDNRRTSTNRPLLNRPIGVR